MKKTILCFLLAAALLMLSGCAGKTEAPETTAAPTETIMTIETFPLPSEEVSSEDRELVNTLVNFFVSAYFDGSGAVLKSFLADSFQGSVTVYGDDFPDAVPSVISIKGLGEIGDMEVGDLCYPSVEFISGLPEDDSYTYLSMVMVKQENGWKVQSYGLEK